MVITAKEKIMKKNYSFVFAAIAILSAASCQKELVNAPETDTTNAAPFSFIAEREAETKTVLVEGKSTYWTPGDEISAIDSKGKAQTFIALNAVDMKTPLAENAPAALFYNEMFSIPADGSIHTIYPRKDDVTIDENGVIGILRIGTPQYAVEGSFDPQFASAYAKAEFDPENPQTPPTLTYTNIHTLVKFTIGGDKAPAEIVLTNNGSRNIAGQFKYNTMPEENKSPIIQLDDKGNVLPGGKAITLLPKKGESFEVGKTYYIVVIGGGNFADITLSFVEGEESVVVKTVSGAKYAAPENNHLLNKIINLGTVQFPVEEPEPEPVESPLELVWDAAVPFGGGQDRNMTMDSEYVYVAQAVGGNGAIKAISIVDPAQTKDVKVTTYTPAGLDNGTHAISCVRMLPNTDPAVNGGKDVLVASNLTAGDGTEKLIVYIWSNGIDADPNYFVIDSGARRLGDKFTVKGTYQAGELHFFDFKDGNTVVRVNVKEGVAGLWGTPELAYATGRYAMPVAGANNIGECTIHPDATFDGDGNPNAALLTTNAVNGFFTQDKGNVYAASAWGTDPALTQTYGYNFFSHNDKNYIAYVKVAGDRNSAALNIIEDVNGAADFKGTLEAQTGRFTAPVNGTGNAGHGVGDCATVVIDGTRYISVMAQNIGISLYKFKDL